MELRQLYLSGKKRLKDAGIDSAEAEARMLLSTILGTDIKEIYSNPTRKVDDESGVLYSEILERRISKEPVAYVTGYAEFLSRGFFVNSDVLIPRPETELLVQSILDEIPPEGVVTVADVGTGSGCIATTLCLERPGISAIATDISLNALKVARLNAMKHGVYNRIGFVRSDLILAMQNGTVDIIAANLPYIGDEDFKGLPEDVKNYEPEIALRAGIDGMLLINKLIESAGRVLKSNGLLFLEIGYDQYDSVRRHLIENGLSINGYRTDDNGIKRMIFSTWKK